MQITRFLRKLLSVIPAGFLTHGLSLDAPSHNQVAMAFCISLPVHSDRIVQDFHLIPFKRHVLACSIQVVWLDNLHWNNSYCLLIVSQAYITYNPRQIAWHFIYLWKYETLLLILMPATDFDPHRKTPGIPGV